MGKNSLDLMLHGTSLYSPPLVYVQTQTRWRRGCSTNITPPSLINWLNESTFSSKSSEHLHSQTVRARFTSPHLSCFTCHVVCVMYHMSHVICHMSYATCHMPHVLCQKIYMYLDKGAKLVRGRSVINGATQYSFNMHQQKKEIWTNYA